MICTFHARAVLSLAAILLVGAFARFGISADIFVDNRAGNDRYDGRTARAQGTGVGPVRTIQTAVRRAYSGDRVVLLPTPYPYHESVTIHRRLIGTQEHPLVIEGNGAELIGFEPIDPVQWEYVRNGVHRLRRIILTRTWLLDENGRLPQADSLSSIENGQVAFIDGSVLMKVAKGEPIGSPVFISVLPAGIYVDRTSNVVVRNLRVRGFHIDGIQIKGPAHGVRIENCELDDNARSGMGLFTNAEVEVVNVRANGNRVAGLLADNYVDVEVEKFSADDAADRLLVGSSARVTDRGGDADPLGEGPFVIPRGWKDDGIDDSLPPEFEPEE